MNNVKFILVLNTLTTCFCFIFLYSYSGFCNENRILQKSNDFHCDSKKVEIELLHIVNYMGRALGKPILFSQGVDNLLKISKATLPLQCSRDDFEKDTTRALALYGEALKTFNYTMIERESCYYVCPEKSALKSPYLPNFHNAKTDFDRIVKHQLVLQHISADFVRSYFEIVQNVTNPMELPDKKTLIVICHYSKVKKFIEIVKKFDVPQTVLTRKTYILRHLNAQSAQAYIESTIVVEKKTNTPLILAINQQKLLIEASDSMHNRIGSTINVLDIEGNSINAK